jgi:hypothetical protein
MNSRMTPLPPAIDVAEQWQRAVRGDAEARRTLLERIMSRRSSRPNTPRLSTSIASR